MDGKTGFTTEDTKGAQK